MAFCYSEEDQPVYLYLSTHLSHIEVVQLTVDAHDSLESGLHWERLPQSTLQKQMLRNQRRFDRRNELGGLSLMKTWGLASLDGYIAACITLHPGDMAEYCIPSQERAIIVFSAHGVKDYSATLESFPWDVDPIVEDDLETHVSILDSFFKCEQLQRDAWSKFDNKIIYAAVVASMLIWDEARLKRLLMAESALLRLAGSTEVDLAPEITCLKFLLKSSPDVELANAKVKEATGSRNKETLSLSSAQHLLDICSFCAHAISWESLTEAFCTAGHQFGRISSEISEPSILLMIVLARCSLTFLAIKEPGISKYCENCNRAYYNEALFDDCSRKRNAHSNDIQEESVESPIPSVEEVADTEIFDEDLKRINRNRGTSSGTLDLEFIKLKSSSLATMLFDTFDICPYCGGKFID